jgi:hypothetical protein
VIAVKGHAQLGERSLDERRLQDDAGQSDVARGLQIDMVERRRQVISAVARTKLSKGFRVGDGKFLVRAKSQHGIANFLRLRHSHASRADPGNHADDAIVARSAINGVDHIAQRLADPLASAAPMACSARPRVRLLEIGFENGLGWNFSLHADHRHHHDDHSDQLRSAQLGWRGKRTIAGFFFPLEGYAWNMLDSCS